MTPDPTPVGENAPHEFDRWKSLLGLKVEVYLGADGQKKVCATGHLLAFGDYGEARVLGEDGEVTYCWPMLEVRALCATCGNFIEYLDAPSGSWWVHDEHPEDAHDAAPLGRSTE